MSTPIPTHELRAATPTPRIPPTMTAVVGDRYGTADVLEVRQVSTPTPAPDQVLVRVEASSLNPLDWHFLTGTPYFLRLIAGLVRPKHPIGGADVAGTVVAVGREVDDLRRGDVVFGVTDHGGFARYVAVSPANLVHKPLDVAFESAAATPLAGLTALQALRTHADVQPGERVLVNGAAGGVGTFAVQLAAVLGAEVTAVCSTRNVEMLHRLGAAEVVDYRRDDVVAGGARFDVMIDNVGNRSTRDCLAVLRPEGRYVATSGPKDNRLLGPVLSLARRSLAFAMASQSYHQFTVSPDRDDLADLARLLADRRISPAIDRVVGLEGVEAGLTEIGTGHARAKIVVTPA